MRFPSVVCFVNIIIYLLLSSSVFVHTYSFAYTRTKVGFSLDMLAPRSDKDRQSSFASLLINNSIRLCSILTITKTGLVLAEPSTTKGYQTKSGLRYFDYLEGSGVQPRYGKTYGDVTLLS